MSRSPRRIVLFGAVTGLLGFGAAEAFSRVAEGASDALMGPYEAGGADGDIGFAPGAELFHGEARTLFNDGAYVGPHRPEVKPPGVTRIIVLGDSFTFGWGVGEEHAWPALVDAALPGVEVLNFAVPGQNTWLELEHYRRTARAYAPDLVLLGWYLNDAVVDRRSPNVHRLCPLPTPPIERAWAAVQEVSALARVVADLRRVADHGSPLPAWESDTHVREEAFGFACSMHWLEELEAEVEADGAELVVVRVPHLDGVGSEHDPEREAQQRLSAALKRRGLEHIGLYGAVRGATADAMQTPDLHPSVAAHVRFADVIAPFLARRLSVPSVEEDEASAQSR